jgi:hypothetical protein
VVAVVDLEADHAGVGHPFDQLVRHRGLVAPHPGVRKDADATRASDERDGVDRVEGVLRDAGRPAVGDVPVERLLLGLDDPGLDHRLRDVRPNDVAAARDLADAFERDRQPERLELLDHELAAAQTRVTQTSELLAKGGIVDVRPEAEDVDARAEVLGGELDAGNDVDADLDARRRRLLEAVGRVVVRERDDVELALGRQTNELGRRERAVGAVRMRVQVDAGHARVIVADALDDRHPRAGGRHSARMT